MRTCIKAWMSSKFGQIRPLVSMVTDSVIFEKWCCRFFLFFLDGILFILTGNYDIHKSLDEFEIWPDPTTDHRVSCPLASKNLMFPFFLALYNGSQVIIVALWATCWPMGELPIISEANSIFLSRQQKEFLESKLLKNISA